MSAPLRAALAFVLAMPAIALIVDDLGDRPVEGARAVALPGAVALAFLPHTPHAAALARQAHADGKEVMLHLPLQAVEGNDLGPGAITLDTTEGEFSRVFGSGLASVPHASGVNTHMGSLLTRHPGHMAWLMSGIVGHGGLFFVDSYTAPESIALPFAREAGVPAARRDVFLDPDPQPEAIAFQFARLLKLARENGNALGIGHPYPATLDLLERELPRLETEHGVRLIGVRELIELRDLQL